MTDFQRARTHEQRSERRRRILETASSMLAEMPVAAITLNELSRRVGLAKSNLLRYFESREAVLLELLDEQSIALLADLGAVLAKQVDASEPAGDRVHSVAAAVTEAIGARPKFCELLSAQAGVLEHNVSVEVAARHKRAALERLSALAALLHRSLPELDTGRAAEAALTSIIIAGALWTYSQPGEAVRAALEGDETLAAARIHFTETLRRSVTITLLGLLTDTAAKQP